MITGLPFRHKKQDWSVSKAITMLVWSLVYSVLFVSRSQVLYGIGYTLEQGLSVRYCLGCRLCDAKVLLFSICNIRSIYPGNLGIRLISRSGIRVYFWLTFVPAVFLYCFFEFFVRGFYFVCGLVHVAQDQCHDRGQDCE
jgi:hypothetical protein